MKLQLARRTDGYNSQAKNVRVQVGSSSQYNANDPVCTDIDQLTGTGLVEYHCDQFHEGQYVILSNDQNYLTICEAKVFVETGKLLNQRLATLTQYFTPLNRSTYLDIQYYLRSCNG